MLAQNTAQTSRKQSKCWCSTIQNEASGEGNDIEAQIAIGPRVGLDIDALTEDRTRRLACCLTKAVA